jgi:hypothetical protein
MNEFVVYWCHDCQNWCAGPIGRKTCPRCSGAVVHLSKPFTLLAEAVKWASQCVATATDSEMFQPWMSLRVDKAEDAVELLLDTSLDMYSESIQGEGADVWLIRNEWSGNVIGVRLPLLRDNLVVLHDGPLRINEGFRADDELSRLQAIIDRSPWDQAPCQMCGETVLCVPDGLQICRYCAEKQS